MNKAREYIRVVYQIEFLMVSTFRRKLKDKIFQISTSVVCEKESKKRDDFEFLGFQRPLSPKTLLLKRVQGTSPTMSDANGSISPDSSTSRTPRVFKDSRRGHLRTL